MRKAIFAIVGLLSIGASAGSVTLTGSQAKNLVGLAGELEIGDAGLGHVYVVVEETICTKQVTAQTSEIICSVKTDGQVSSKVSTKDNQGEYTNALIDFRNLLAEVTGADVKISDTQRELKVKSINCEGLSTSFDLDDIDSNVSSTYSCQIEF